MPARSSRSDRAPRGAASRPPIRTRPAPSGVPRDPEGQAGRHDPGLSGEPLQLPRRPSCSTRPSARCPRSTTRAGRCSPTGARSTSTARAARTSTPAASPSSSATKGIATATASTSSAARARRPTRTARVAAFRRSRGRLADRPRPSVLRLHRAGDRLRDAAARTPCRSSRADAARHLSADSCAAGRREPDGDRRRGRDGRRRWSAPATWRRGSSKRGLARAAAVGAEEVGGLRWASPDARR